MILSRHVAQLSAMSSFAFRCRRRALAKLFYADRAAIGRPFGTPSIRKNSESMSGRIVWGRNMHKITVLGSLTVLLLSPVTQADDPEAVDGKVSKDADVALTADVKDALTNSGIAKTGEIQIETDDGVVQLSGFVDSESTQELALRAAKSVKGVESVRNDLVVSPSKPTKSEAKDDAIIAAKVRKELQQQPNAKAARDINVDVNEGVVQLSGFVESVDDKNRAADVVASVAGVKDVRNDIALGR